MPTYEYKCEKCGHQFETVLTVHDHDAHRTAYPKCKSKKVEQLVSTFLTKTDSKT